MKRDGALLHLFFCGVRVEAPIFILLLRFRKGSFFVEKKKNDFYSVYVKVSRFFEHLLLLLT